MTIRTKCIFAVTLILLMAVLLMPVGVYAHGAHVQYTTSNLTVEITAKYDNGEPMSGAQVTVYTPDDPSTAWLTGECDDEGRYTFSPDTTISGNWRVKVRLAGHGDIINVPIGEAEGGSSSDGSYSILQIVLMSVCVVWGAIGTALFFVQRRKA